MSDHPHGLTAADVAGLTVNGPYHLCFESEGVPQYVYGDRLKATTSKYLETPLGDLVRHTDGSPAHDLVAVLPPHPTTACGRTCCSWRAPVLPPHPTTVAREDHVAELRRMIGILLDRVGDKSLQQVADVLALHDELNEALA